MKIRSTICSLIITIVGILIFTIMSMITMPRPTQILLEFHFNDNFPLSSVTSVALVIIHPIPLMIVSTILCIGLIILEVRIKSAFSRLLYQFIIFVTWACIILAARSAVISSVIFAMDSFGIPVNGYGIPTN